MVKIVNCVSKEADEKFERDLLATVSVKFISELAKQIHKHFSDYEDKE